HDKMMPERSQQQTSTGAGMQFGYGHFDVMSLPMQNLNEPYGYYQQPGLYQPFGPFEDQSQWQTNDTQQQMPYHHPVYNTSINEIPRSPFDYAPHYLTGHPPQYGHPGFPSTFPQTSFDMSWTTQVPAFAQQQNQQLQQSLGTQQQTQMNALQGGASGNIGKKPSVYDEYLPESLGSLRANTSGVGQNVDMLTQQMSSVDISEHHHHPHSLQQQHSKQLQDSFTLNDNEPNSTSTNHTNSNTGAIPVLKEHQHLNIGSNRNSAASASQQQQQQQQSSGGPKSYASVVSSDTNKILPTNSSNTARQQQQQTSSSTAAIPNNQQQQSSSVNQTNIHDRNNLTSNNTFGNESIRNSGAGGGRNNYSSAVMSGGTGNNYGQQQRGSGTTSGGYNSRNNQQSGGTNTLSWAHNSTSNSNNTTRGGSGNGQSSNYHGNSNYYERSSNNNTGGGNNANNQYSKRAYSTALGSSSSNNYQQQYGQYSTGGGNRSSNISNGSSSSATQPITAANQEILDNLKRNHQYNPKDFNLSPKGARFFVIKSYSEDDVHRSIKYNIWCSTENGNKRLDVAFREREGKGPLYLFFSVNASGHFCGMAEMMSPVDYDTKTDVWHMSNKWQGKFEVKWIYVKDVPNQQFRNIRLENNENKPVTNSRDTQEIPYEKGKQMLKTLHFFRDKTSIFDDFQYYESKQAEESKKQVSSGSNNTLGNQSDTSNQNDTTYKNNTSSSFRKSNTSPGGNKSSNRSTPSPALGGTTVIQKNDVEEMSKQKSSEANVIHVDNEGEDDRGQNNVNDNE
ncbi:unnamed protein product, partial [Didymodactylos carnosus]